MSNVRIKLRTVLMALLILTILWLTIFFTFIHSQAPEPTKSDSTTSTIIRQNSTNEIISVTDTIPTNSFYGSFIIPEDNYQVIEQVSEKREKIKDAFLHAWNGYVQYAWGYDELKPVSNVGVNNWGGLGATIVDSIDTMIIMGLEGPYEMAKGWVEKLSWDVDYDASTFETTIRYLGGLEAAYELTKESIFLEKAEALAVKLLPAFSTNTGIPYSTVNLKTGAASSPSWSQGSSFLAEFGTLQLEFKYLSKMTGNSLYAEKVEVINQHMFNADVSKWDGLYPIKYHPTTGKFQNSEIKFGARGDSFYEYLLKQYLQTGRTDKEMKRIYDRSMEGVKRNLIHRSPVKNLVYIAEKNGDRVVHKMDHLVCFAAGMFALDGNEEHLSLAKEIMETCYESYKENASGLGPEIIGFEPNRIKSGTDFYNDAAHYILRPETVESLMILYRVTGDKKYQEWGWNIFQALEKNCKTSSAYSGIRDVGKSWVTQDDRMESFFMAETLKYLYLLFSPPNYISLEEFVFNTEAHPTRKFKENSAK